MSCCGSKRARMFQSSSDRSPERVTSTMSPVPARQPVIFVYTGEGGHTVRGAVSGTMYRFDHHGASLEVAYEDSFAMMGERVVGLKASEVRRG
jgi:hypothetical protein